MAKRVILGCKDAFLCRRFASLEHPWASYLWHTDEAKELCEMEGVYVTCYSHCCYGGRREKWQSLVHICMPLVDFFRAEKIAFSRVRSRPSVQLAMGYASAVLSSIHGHKPGTIAMGTQPHLLC